MCGIAGAFDTQSDSLKVMERVKNMTALLGHRGPDYSSVQTLGDAVFGHSRLSIIDTSNESNQPFLGANRKTALTYNGEIYNFKALRSVLQGEGAHLKTDGDTEVLLHLLNRHKLAALPKLNGMFAFGYWDSVSKSMLLVRDRLGIKPLYYTFKSGGLYFASELRALKPVIDAKLNHAQLSRFLSLQSVPGEQTIFDEVHELPPGHYLKYDQHGKYEVTPWYNLLDVLNQEKKEEITPEGLRNQFFKAVQRRLVSDVPIGAFLSGGVDSSAVVAAMAQQSKSPVKTFSVGFEDEAFDERIFATEVANLYKTDHQEIVLSEKEVLDSITEAVLAMDTPTGDAVNTFIVSKFTKQSGLTVALSGLGGDELFSGYPSFSTWNYLKNVRWASKAPHKFRKFLSGIIPGSGIQSAKIKSLLSGSITPAEVVYRLRQVFTDDMVSKLGIEPWQWLSVFGTDIIKPQDELSYAELQLYCSPVLLKDTDQMSMAHALEVRVPFLDHEFLSFVSQIPVSRRKAVRGKWPKWYFIEALKNDIPESTYQRKKAGFVLPMDRWMKKELLDFTMTGLQTKAMKELFSNKYLDTLTKDFFEETGKTSWSRIWLLSVLGNWIEKNTISL